MLEDNMEQVGGVWHVGRQYGTGGRRVSSSMHELAWHASGASRPLLMCVDSFKAY